MAIQNNQTAVSARVIVAGRLDFGNERTFDRMLGVFRHRIDNFYRNEVLFTEETDFQAEDYSLHYPRLVIDGDAKIFNNTVDLLDHLSPFAVAGQFNIWLVQSGQVLKWRNLEPNSEKKAVKAYNKGKNALDEQSAEEAYDMFTKAIGSFANHAQAYERRGFVNFKLGKLEDALYDYDKSIKLFHEAPKAYLGRAFVYLKMKEEDKAMENLQLTLKNAIPHQKEFWIARRLRAELQFQEQDYDPMLKELKFFATRKYPEDHPAIKYQRRLADLYGQALMAKEAFDEAIEAFDKAIHFHPTKLAPSNADLLVRRGIARQKAGKTGYIDDWATAKELGSTQACALLQEQEA